MAMDTSTEKVSNDGFVLRPIICHIARQYSLGAEILVLHFCDIWRLCYLFIDVVLILLKELWGGALITSCDWVHDLRCVR